MGRVSDMVPRKHAQPHSSPPAPLALYRYDDLNECFWLRGQLVLLSPDLFTQSGDARRERRATLASYAALCRALAPATDEAAPLGEVRVNEKGEREKVDARLHRVARLAHETLRTAGGLAYFGKTYFEVTAWGVERASCPHRAILRLSHRAILPISHRAILPFTGDGVGTRLPRLLPRVDLARRSLHILAAAAFGGGTGVPSRRRASRTRS